MSGALDGRNVVITGASSGIGAATAIEATRRGARVALVARRADRLAEVAAECRAIADRGHLTIAADLADLDGIESLAGALRSGLDDRIDVLINNAGVPKRRRTNEMSPADVEEVMAINYFSPVRLTLALLPSMIERSAGDIVNVSSMGVHMAAFGVSAYSASKAALEMFTEGMFLELANTGVRAHLFVPGTTLSEFSTDKPGNNPPFPTDPASASTSEQVAVALLDSLATDEFRSFTGERESGTATAREADVNAWLANMQGIFSKM